MTGESRVRVFPGVGLLLMAVSLAAHSASGSRYDVNSDRPGHQPEKYYWRPGPPIKNNDGTWTFQPRTSIGEPMPDMPTRMERMIRKVQFRLVKALEAQETGGKKFQLHRTNRTKGSGESVMYVLQSGDVFEKAGVGVSVARHTLPPKIAQQMRARGKDVDEGSPFISVGISCIIHPRNPMVPAIHFNYRYFEVKGRNGSTQWWFGGGTDLTPYYLDEGDALAFHSTLKKICDKYEKGSYEKFKRNCDSYFTIAHRNETRGIGGIFFDDLTTPDQKLAFAFVKSCAKAVVPLYLPLVRKHKYYKWNSTERKWQLIRRGRYIEFNLIYDRGTKYGLQSTVTIIENVFMAAPPKAIWEYKYEPQAGSREADLMEVLRHPRDWA
ncbi:oxygen-dependent coproporphyrinogen-III oxidase-like [Copidosoma floridanum]|uniref:oxygen-dependent coproporphyrinogen-III oxidase-like n=1 Tax=Copidosoma floridanum TaxID=29053 RepID=UPI0006C9C715|nr:oxygen-dependent coproporphyrinogen-III oxidase-like [Copidosoma floridanum]